ISMDLRMDRSSPGKYNSSMVNSGSLYINTGSLYVNSVYMANLKYSDKHNMVAFLKKPNESVGFTEVVDFLKGKCLRYALTHNPTIYDSLVNQFWQTTIVRTLANGTRQLVASIDSKEYNITEASVRSKHQLADATGIHNLSDAEIYAGLAILGSYEAPLPEGNTFGSAEDNMQLKELMDIVPKLVTRIETLETELQQTKTTYGKAVLTLVNRGVSKVKSTDKGKRYRRRARSAAKIINTRLVAEEEINTGIEEVSTGSAKVDSGTASKRGQREGKAPMVEKESV
ncbi:hypothetical protein Tco_1140341, partial [Tanacetum coccineum]